MATAPTPVLTRATSTAMAPGALASLVASTVVPVVSTTSTDKRVDSTVKCHCVKGHLKQILEATRPSSSRSTSSNAIVTEMNLENQSKGNHRTGCFVVL
uniref:Putative secreted protein n=1 Tax=Ixodes ricinus TaxID=34613 RepID=A0A6B0U580_IXORI